MTMSDRQGGDKLTNELYYLRDRLMDAVDGVDAVLEVVKELDVTTSARIAEATAERKKCRATSGDDDGR